MLRRLLLAMLSLVAVALLVAPTVGAAPAETETFVVKDEVNTEADVNPCTGVPGTVTTVSNGVIHTTANANGFHITGTFTGTFEFVPDDPGEPTYTGRYTVWFGGNAGPGENFTETFRVNGTGSDGSRIKFNGVTHVTVNANGVPTAEFDFGNCRQTSGVI